MTALQFSIGAINDLHDAPTDTARTPPKPIAEGLVRPRTALVVAILAATCGLLLALASGPGATVVAALGLAVGYAYDLRLSRTAWSWLPLAIALPLVPVFAWLGATGHVPAFIGTIVPAATLAGGGLAVGNALIDSTPGESAPGTSIVRRLGWSRAWLAHDAALAAAVGSALWVLPPVPSSRVPGLLVIGAAVVVLVVGATALRSRAAIRRRAGWALEAGGVAILGIGWVIVAAGAQVGR